MKRKRSETVKLSWLLNAEVPVVWSMWTEPEKVKLWFGSDPNGKVMATNIDLQEGGRYEVTFRNADGSEYTCFGSYLTIQPYARLAFTWAWKNRPAHVELVKLEFAGVQNRTRMTFEHSEFDQETGHNYAEGWRATFRKLENEITRFA